MKNHDNVCSFYTRVPYFNVQLPNTQLHSYLDQFYLTMVYQLQKQFSINWTEKRYTLCVTNHGGNPIMAYIEFPCQHLPHGVQDYEKKLHAQHRCFSKDLQFLFNKGQQLYRLIKSYMHTFHYNYKTSNLKSTLTESLSWSEVHGFFLPH